MPTEPTSTNRAFAIDKTWLRNSFSRSAQTYNQVAILQKEVATRLIERLEFIKHTPEKILDLGSGTGFCSNQLLEMYPKSNVISLDLAFGMLNYARSQKSWFARMRQKQNYICADAELLPLKENSLDMVVSSLALQWCFNLEKVFQSLYHITRPGGLIMFSTMGPDTLKELRQSWAQVDDINHVSGFYDMHDIGDTLVRAGFSNPVMDVEHITLTYQNVSDLMRDLKALGSRNALAERSRGLTGKVKFKQMLQAYEQFRTAGSLPATYEIVYGHAWIPEIKKSTSDRLHDFPIPVISR